jgi:hypothetical protein
MEVHTGFLNQKNSSKKSKISGKWFSAEGSNQRNLMQMQSETSTSSMELIEYRSEVRISRVLNR